MERSIKLIINKSEITAGTRGASLGPEALMTVARQRGSYYFGEHDQVVVKDWNHLLDSDVRFKSAKRIEGLVNVFNEVSEVVSETLNNGSFPLVIAADHGSAGGTIAGIKKTYPDKRLGVVWIDAHGDVHTPYTTPSGNMHGMPLSTAMAVDNKESQVNNPDSEVDRMWEELKSIGGISPKVNPEDIVFIAVRDTEPEEDALIERLGITNHTVDSMRNVGVSGILEKTLMQLDGCDILYISFDVDSMDPKYTSHGTGTPVDNGLTPVEAEELLVGLSGDQRTVCVEFVEINPCLDEKINKMAEVSFDLLEKTTNALN